MKKFICLLISVVLIFSMSACSSEVNNTAKSEELKAKYSFYEKSVKEISKQMKVTQEQADEIFIILVGCGMNQEPNYIIGSGTTYTVDVGKIGEGVTNYYVTIENGIVSEVKADSEVVYQLETSNSSSETSSETNSNQVEIPAPRETAIGKSDKVVDWFISPEATTVRNDVTGNWRYSGFSESGVDISEYALNYYQEYFKSDDEIHAVINFANNTTTRISCMFGMLFVTVFEYVEGEEHDAKLMFSGDVLQDFIVYTDNGDIELIDDPTSDVSTPGSSSDITSTPDSTSSSSSSTKENHFNDYSNPEQQNTTQCVLNTSTKKYHYPSCPDVKKIKPQNYSTIESEAAARALGYTACKRCH